MLACDMKKKAFFLPLDIQQTIAKELSIEKWQAEAAIKLLDEGNTIPFITRYRKEVTGSLNDEQLCDLYERLNELRFLEEKKVEIIKNIESQKKMTPELKNMILSASNLMLVEDLYRPYIQKVQTRGVIAIKKGLQALADIIVNQTTKNPISKEAQPFICKEKGIPTVEIAISGAKDIIAERISDNAEYRSNIREFSIENGSLKTSAVDPNAESEYELYYQYDSPIQKLPGYRILAINRGEKEKRLTVSIENPVSEIIGYLESKVITKNNPNTTNLLKEAIQDSYDRIIAPSVEQEIRETLTKAAQRHAIKIFAYNLYQLLMQPPIVGKVVCGWDPAFRTGCKLAIVDPTGKVLDTSIIYPTPPMSKIEESKATLKDLINKYGISLISVGNGTASRESEVFIAKLIKEVTTPLEYVIVDEAGASVYSTSIVARNELPQYDVYQRGAISIARRIQDPLAELVKIDPKSIGVGQYQHDMNQIKLSRALDIVVERCVNRVGVDLNTASSMLMMHVSGITKRISRSIVRYREKNGPFKNRQELLKVPMIGSKVFQQCAGFMRIKGGNEPLDSTCVHPESYEIARQLIAKLGLKIDEELADGSLRGITQMVKDVKAMAAELKTGVPTLEDIIKELEKPARDPRDEMPKPILRHNILEINDLTKDMVLLGTVRNITDFGAFIDIGVHQDGLVHISEMSDKFVKHPLEVVRVGDVIKVKVLSVDLKKKRINLTMKNI